MAEKKKTVASIATQKKVVKSKTTQKKKFNEDASREKARGKLGCWGTDLIFETSSRKLFAPKDIKITQEGRWESHKILNQVPRSQFLGPDQRQVVLTLTLSAEHGVKPRNMINVIEKAARSGKVEYLVIGGKIIGSNKMEITNASEEWETVYNRGELVRAKVDVTFLEYS